jgi:uncharacterized protein YjbI with pentapeptide repeats
MDAIIESPNKLIDAKIILTQIENGEELDYDQITISGKLDFSGLKLQLDEDGHYIIKAPIKIKHSNIQGPTKILNVNFMDSVNFCGTTFFNADFQGSVFAKFAGFEDAIFTGYASFDNAKFIDDASFTNSQFSECTLVRFDGAIFQKDAFFWGISGRNTIFGGNSLFCHAKFHGIAEFSNVIFLGEANFSSCRFYGEHKGTASFWNDRFKSTANFSGVFFEIVNFSASHFEDNLNLTGAMFSRFNVQWDIIKDKLICDDSVLLALITNFRNLGQFDDSDNCYYRYKKRIQEQRGIGLKKILDLLSFISCGYGVRPFYTLYVSALLITFFALLFWFGDGIGGLQSSTDAFYYSALAFTANSKSINWIGIYKYVGLVEGFIGWLFMALFLVTLGRTWLR